MALNGRREDNVIYIRLFEQTVAAHTFNGLHAKDSFVLASHIMLHLPFVLN